MSYCTARDVRNALSPRGVSEDNNIDPNALPDWQIQDAIVEAETIINVYLSRRYIIPDFNYDEPDPIPVGDGEEARPNLVFVAAPQPVRMWTRTLAAYYATMTFRVSKDIAEDDPIRLRQLQVMDALKLVRDGGADLALPPAGGGDPEDTGTAVAFNLYEGTLFGPEDFNLTAANDRQRIASLYGWHNDHLS